MKRRSFIPAGLVLTVLVAAMLGGCIDDRYAEKAPSGDEVQLLVELNVPGVSTAAVRSFTKVGNEEEKINELDVLVFEVNGATETFAYKTHGVLESGKYKVNLKKSTAGETYRFVFFANLRTEVNAAVSHATTGFTSATSKEDALAAIKFDASGVWNTTTTPLRYLPMWGESTGVHTVSATLTDIGTVYMLRSVARVDILFNPSSSSTAEDPLAELGGLPNFRVDEVAIRNVSTVGAAAPLAENVNGIRTSSLVATLPTVPTSDTGNITYFRYVDAAKNEFVREIYIAESANTGGTPNGNINEAAMTCLVVKLTNTAASTSSWYRLDFVADPATNLRWDILRNYRYTFNIKSITGQGYGSADAALVAPPMNLEYDMTVSGEDGITTIISDGQYMLGVSQKAYSFSCEKRTKKNNDNALYIKTNYTGGWTVTSDSNWLGLIDATTGDPITGGDDATNVKLGLTINTSKSPRSGSLRISLANGLSVDIAVAQERIIVQQGDANCYMTLPDRSVAFYVSRAIWYNPALSKHSDFTVAKLWEEPVTTGDVEGGISFHAIVIESDDPCHYIVVTGGEKPGNGGVAARVDGVTCWSYHIWVTDYTGAETWTNNGFTFMDRNLGATTATNTVTGCGLVYQWGRKDPFPGTKLGSSVSANLIRDQFQALGARLSLSPIDNTTDCVRETVKNPTKYYSRYYDNTLNTNLQSWFPEIDATANALWGATKTEYDPCPKGWRVPTSGDGTASPWYGLTRESSSPAFSYGFTWSGNAWPITGYRAYYDGESWQVDLGYYWSVSVAPGNSGRYCYYLRIANTTDFNVSCNNNFSSRASAMAVRCVR